MNMRSHFDCPVLKRCGGAQSHPALIRASNGVVCCVYEVLAGSMSYFIYVAYKYSDYFNYGGLYFGKLLYSKGLNEGWLFRNRLHDQNDDMWRRFGFVTWLGGPFLYIGAAVLKNQV